MSDSALRLKNRGAYTSPFSGVGVEFFPLGVMPDHSGLILHEAGYLPENDWWEFPHVLSPFWRLYYNRRRGHRVILDGKELELGPDHIVVIGDHQLFHCRGREPVPSLWFSFNVARRPAPQQAMPIVLRPSRTELDLIDDVTRSFHTADAEPDRERIFHGSLALLHVVLSRPEIQWQGNAPTAVVQVIQHIEKHYASPLYIPGLAAMVRLCTEALARSFKRYQGMTIGQFIVRVRVREAAHLLTQTDATLDEIAERTGFPNRAYLSRVFKKLTGESPAGFRHRHSIDAPRSDASPSDAY